MATTDEPCGGDPPCWSHLVEDAEAWAAASGATGTVDLTGVALAAAVRGPAWTLRSEDLDMNLLVFGDGEGVAEHPNEEVDVLLVGVAGAGIVTIDGTPHPLAGGQAILVPKGARRGIRAHTDRFSYLTCHRRRPGLWPTTGGRAAASSRDTPVP